MNTLLFIIKFALVLLLAFAAVVLVACMVLSGIAAWQDQLSWWWVIIWFVAIVIDSYLYALAEIWLTEY